MIDSERVDYISEWRLMRSEADWSADACIAVSAVRDAMTGLVTSDYIQQHTPDTVLLTRLINLSVSAVHRHLLYLSPQISHHDEWTDVWPWWLSRVVAPATVWLWSYAKYLSIITRHRRCYTVLSSLHSTTLSVMRCSLWLTNRRLTITAYLQVCSRKHTVGR